MPKIQVGANASPSLPPLWTSMPHLSHPSGPSGIHVTHITNDFNTWHVAHSSQQIALTSCLSLIKTAFSTLSFIMKVSLYS